MEDAPESSLVGEGFGSILELALCIGSHADEEFWLQNLDDFLDVLLTRLLHGQEGSRREFIGGKIGSGIFHPDQRAVVGDEMLIEKFLRFLKFLREESPESLSGNLGTRTVESGNGAFGMLQRRFADCTRDFQPVPDVLNFSEGNPCLGHAVGPGVHSHEEDALGPGAVFFQILDMGRPGILERVVGVGDWFGKGESAQVLAQGVGGEDEGRHSGNGDEGVETVDRTGGEDAGVVPGVGGLDANEIVVGVIWKVTQGGGLLLPRIPDHGGERAAFRDFDLAVPIGIMKSDRVTGSIVDAVDFVSDGELFLGLDGVGFGGGGCVEVGGVLETGEVNLVDVGDGEVGMKGTAKRLGFGRVVKTFEAQSERGSQGASHADKVLVGNVLLVGVGIFGNEAEQNVVADFFRGFELPEAVAGDAVGGVRVGNGRVGVEPGPAEWNPAANGLSLAIDGSGRGVEDGMGGVTWLPMGQMGPMEREGGSALFGFDL